jgi:hypothetical protein
MTHLPVIVAFEADDTSVDLYDNLLDIDALEARLRLSPLDLATTLYYTAALLDP